MMQPNPRRPPSARRGIVYHGHHRWPDRISTAELEAAAAIKRRLRPSDAGWLAYVITAAVVTAAYVVVSIW